ncbi:Hypothetical predicted protein [Podarcis lilfordi]|uniref:Uncharacterized protein n=1 Tax=Podarcis lilfordi TaxID=74358 RepID=A0AA35K453_9SAUR|nr:Hypothetical predicted protein [Podarcis lilfordi]
MQRDKRFQIVRVEEYLLGAQQNTVERVKLQWLQMMSSRRDSFVWRNMQWLLIPTILIITYAQQGANQQAEARKGWRKICRGSSTQRAMPLALQMPSGTNLQPRGEPGEGWLRMLQDISLDMIAVGCELNGVHYGNGHNFQPTPLYKCLCVNGAIGCTPVFISKPAPNECAAPKSRKKSGQSKCVSGQQEQQSTSYRLMSDLCQAFKFASCAVIFKLLLLTSQLSEVCRLF